MKIITLLMCLLCAEHVFCNRYEEEIVSKIVQVVIENEKVPSILSVISCWTKTQQFRFTKPLQIPLQIINHFEIPESVKIKDDNTNKRWYFINMQCKESENYLQKIDQTLFGHPYRWILFEPNIDHLHNLTFLPDANVISINFNEKMKQYDLNQSNFF